MTRSQTLEGKTAIVTGASEGIGFSCAKHMLADGATVFIMARREEALAKARAELLDLTPGGRVETFAGNGCEEDAVKKLLDKAVDLTGRLDILVPTVGGGGFKPLLMQDAETFRQEFEMNVISAFLMMRYGAPLMKSGGSIVCISAVPVVQPFTGLSTYLSSKAALERLVRSAADELGGYQVRVNSVRPGLTLSPGVAEFFGKSDLLEKFIARVPLERAGLPDDIARVVRFLAGPESGWVTGQNFSADGGQEQRLVPDLIYQAFGKELMDKVRAEISSRNNPAAN
jgi:NAD(P)-dependent dehydrogenase (short-subunit alcohol dehydrogenase family)